MSTDQTNYARSQVDGLDNIAPTTVQGERAWQYAKSDNFFSPEEQMDVLRQQIEPYRAQIESKLAAVGWGPEYLAKLPTIQDALFSGQQTIPLEICLTPTVKMNGSLRIVMTDAGPDIRITPSRSTLLIPEEINGVRLSKAEQQHLYQDKSLPRPLLMADKGDYVPTYIRADADTNTVELWRIRPEQLPTKLLGIDLTKDQQMQLAYGHPVRLNGLLDQQGEPFNATVNVSAVGRSLQFGDLSRLDVSLKPGDEFRQQVAQNNEGAKTDINLGREASIGAPAVSNRQSEAIKELLEMEPQDKSPKLHR